MNLSAPRLFGYSIRTNSVLVLEQLTMFHLFMAAAERRALSLQSRLQEPGEAMSAAVHPEVPSNQNTHEKNRRAGK